MLSSARIVLFFLNCLISDIMGKKRRLLSMLGLPPAAVRALQDAAFLHDDDVKGLTPTELQEASGLTVSECCEVLRIAEHAAPVNAFTVLDMIENSPIVAHVTSLCRSLDALMGGGLPLGAVTEVAGCPGVGKTQLCLQLCVSVQLPRCVGGMGGEAVYIDTEGSLTATRLQEMAEYAVAHYTRVNTSTKSNIEEPSAVRKLEEDRAGFTAENILKRIHYYRCLSHLSLTASVHNIPALLEQHPGIRLLVVDSVAFHVRHAEADNRRRTGLLCALARHLVQIATRHQLAVIVTNQMTTRISTKTSANTTDTSSVRCTNTTFSAGSTATATGLGMSSGELVPALGESWAHCPTLRLVLRWGGREGGEGVRTATLVKAPHRANAIAAFEVTAAGVRDVHCDPSIAENKLRGDSAKVTTSRGDDSSVALKRKLDALS